MERKEPWAFRIPYVCAIPIGPVGGAIYYGLLRWSMSQGLIHTSEYDMPGYYFIRPAEIGLFFYFLGSVVIKTRANVWRQQHPD